MLNDSYMSLSMLCRYLFLLFSPDIHLSERYIFSTEGHLYPIDFEKYFTAESSDNGCHGQQEMSREQCRWAGSAEKAASSSAMAATEQSSLMAQRRAAVQLAVRAQRRKLAMDDSEAENRMDLGVQNILSTRDRQLGTSFQPKLMGTVSRTLGKKSLGCRFFVNGFGQAVCGAWTTQKPWIFLGEKHVSKIQLSQGDWLSPCPDSLNLEAPTVKLQVLLSLLSFLQEMQCIRSVP